MYRESVKQLVSQKEHWILHEFFSLPFLISLQIFLFPFVRQIFHNAKPLVQVMLVILIKGGIPSYGKVLLLRVKSVNFLALIFKFRHIWSTRPTGSLAFSLLFLLNFVR